MWQGDGGSAADRDASLRGARVERVMGWEESTLMKVSEVVRPAVIQLERGNQSERSESCGELARFSSERCALALEV